MRVIVQEEALRRSEGHHYHHFIHELPTIDAVPVVRCKECWKRGNERECPMCHEEFDGCDYCTIDYTSDDGFCHMGKKMDGGAE